MGTEGPVNFRMRPIAGFDRAMGKPWAHLYGARTRLKRGCTCSYRPCYGHGFPYQSSMGFAKDRYLGWTGLHIKKSVHQ